MNFSKSIFIVLVFVLASVIVHTFYVHQANFKTIDNENRGLKNEVARLKTDSEKIKANHKSDLTAKNQLVAELQEKVQSLENQLAQKETEAQTSQNENQQLQKTEAQLHNKVQNLENQIAQKITETQTAREEIQRLRRLGAELQDRAQDLKNQLAQKKTEAQTFQDQTQQLRKAETQRKYKFIIDASPSIRQISPYPYYPSQTDERNERIWTIVQPLF